MKAEIYSTDSFIPQIFVEHLLCTKYSEKCWEGDTSIYETVDKIDTAPGWHCDFHQPLPP